MGRLTYQIMEQSVLEMFRRIAQQHKVVLFFDDIQYMDQMSFQLLNRVLLTIGTDRLLLCVPIARTVTQRLWKPWKS